MPPPVAPPPPPGNTKSLVKFVADPKGKNEPVDAVLRRWTTLTQTHPVAILKYVDVKSIVQDGPQCGLVALCMVSKAISRRHEVSDILNEAKRQGFTSLGEIFDLASMKKLCNKFVGRPSTIIDFPSEEEMMAALIKGNVFLVPYDADANHEPSEKNGKSAHWAVIFGAVLMRPECYCLEGMEKLSADRTIYRASMGYDCEMAGKDLLLARQGKSRYVAVWGYESLRRSNAQLNECCDKYEGMVLPPGGVKAGLNGRVLRIDL